MATSRICSIPDCGKTAPSNRKGWCAAHYSRWRTYGDPTAGATAKGAAYQFFLDALASQGSDCILWPYSVNIGGYATMRHEGRKRIVSRVVCERVHGAPPTPKHEAAHSCGRGSMGCIAPCHLSWKTGRQNNADKIEHGTHSWGEARWNAKLTVEAVREIRALRGMVTQKELAARFGVSSATVQAAQMGKSWGAAH